MKKILLPFMFALFFGFTCFLHSQEGQETKSVTSQVVSEYYLGVQCSPLPDLLEMHLNLQGKGQLVQYVMPKSPAEKAGIKPGDILLSIGERDVMSVRDILETLATDKDKEQTLSVLQKGKKTEIKLVPEKRPPTPPRTAPAPSGMFRTIQPGIIFDPRDGEDPREMIRKFIEKMDEAGFPADLNDPQGLLDGFGDENSERFEISIMPGKEPGSQRIHVRQNNEVWDVEHIEDLPKEMQDRVKSMIDPMDGAPGENGFFSQKMHVFSEKAGENLKLFREKTSKEMKELEEELKKAYENSPDLRKKFEDYRKATERFFEGFRENAPEATESIETD